MSRDGAANDNGPTGSRASSPGGSVGSFTQQYSAKKHISVTPFKKRGRKAGTRGNRGGKAYVPRPSLVITRGNDYHYGSDFDSGSDSDGQPSHGEDAELDVESDVDIPISEPESDELDDAASDVSLSNHSSSMRRVVESTIKSIPTPLPIWLQSDQDLPVLTLPKSSEDLLLPTHQVLSACAIYEVLRKFSSEVRLSPFRLEDFMAAVQSEELTPLLAEVHVQLLKSMLREEDVQQTWFGPLDQKDSTNSVLNFADTLTWPEVMRIYLQSDPTFAPALSLLESCEYPFTSCDVRLKLLKFLTDHFLCNTAVRQEFLSEGNIKYNDHCRVCHKVGDLLCCETCPAVYHLHCLDPPLENVPNEDWQCPICTAQQCKGVTDCISDVERSGFLCRQECLGYDRHGRKYWFIARRIFVEETGSREEIDGVEESVAVENRKTWYYSSPHQFEQLLAVLDKADFEKALCQELYNLRPEILRQMNITIQLTNEQKGANKSYLELDEEAAREASQAVVKVEKEEDDEEADEKLSVDALKAEKEEVETEEVVEECGVEVDDDFMQQLHVESEPKEPKIEPLSEEPTTVTVAANGTYSTRSKTGTTVARTYVDMKRRSLTANGSAVSVKEENSGTTTKQKSQSPLPTDVIFKLGMEGRHKSYVNQYTSNPLALNKNQAAEERDRKRYLSHKFSLTGSGEFKWSGSTFGNRTVMLQTVRSTLLQLHSQLPAIFMHPNWAGSMRKSWIQAVNQSVSPTDLGRVLSILVACIRPVVFSVVWHESLGHIRLQRQTALEREERKKVDKKEKKDKELEEEMHRLHTVHYTKGLKHQIWKHKGEEFRLHGQWGWRWLSATRLLRRLDARKCGLRAGPWRIVTYSQEEGQESRYVQVDPATGDEIYQIPASDPAMEVVDICAAMNDPDRRVYPKIGKKAKLDSLLDWRLKLKVAEEKNLLKIEKAPSLVKRENVDAEGKQTQKAKLTIAEMETQLEQLRFHRRTFPRCYSLGCDGNSCYSPTCRRIKLLEAGISKEKEEEEKQKAALVKRRIYSSESTKEPLSLKRAEDEMRSKKKKAPVKYPMMSKYMTKSNKRTIFVLPDHELKHLARRYGQAYVQGFHHGPKNNSPAWIYPSARPLFKNVWFFRTNGLQSLSAFALQVRILWACLRWDDVLAKTGSMGMADGKNQTTTDTEIVTTDILKHRHIGRFLERTQYFQRRVVIPLDVPKTVREVTPSRSGLRKRKMVEAPKLSQPIVTEEWVDEDRLELWVIKQYHERVERAAAVAAAAAASATTPSSLTRLKGTPQTMGPGGKPLSMEELKAQAEQQLRAQRTAHQLKSATPGTPGVVRLALPNKVVLPGSKFTSVVSTPPGAAGTTLGRRILITKDGKTTQVVKTTAASPSGSAQPVLIAPSPGVAAATPTASKLQITRGPDGKIEIRGLKPGQQLLRLGDGRFTIVSPAQPMMAAQPAPAQAQAQAQPAAASDGAVTKTIVVQKAGNVVSVAGQKTANQIVLPAGTNAATLTQQLAAGKLQLSSVNGQQVLIRTATPAAGTVTAKTGDTPATVAGQQPKPVMQMIQTAQGQRIVVQNLQGGSLTPQQLAAIQEQLKGQMLNRANQPGGNNKPITIAVRTSAAGTAVASAVATATTTATTTTVVSTSSESSTATVAVSTPTVATPTSTPAATVSSDKSEEPYTVTPDYVVQALRNSLKGGNLHPDLEQKVLTRLREQEKAKRDDADVETPTYFAASSSARKRTTSGASWAEDLDTSAAMTPTGGMETKTARPPARKIARIIEAPTTPTSTKVASIGTPASDAAADLREQKNKERAMKAAQRAKERRHQSALARLHGGLSKHSELLKKEMLRKRALLEKELRVSIQKEISALRLPSPVRQVPFAVPENQTSAVKKKEQTLSESPAVQAKRTPRRNQRKRKTSSPLSSQRETFEPEPGTSQDEEEEEEEDVPSPPPVTTTKRKTKRNSSESGGGKKELFCICRKPYDNSKFYVGCDMCSNWFHGDCVGITEAMSQTMSEFVCDNCKKAQQNTTRELFCLCRQPYDESQFYICCDRCQEWLHGRCVGVLQTESESIDEYKCPNCDPQGALNYANTRTLGTRDYEELRKLLRQLQTHKSSWPFREPVKEKDVPDYYQIIKDPMDLRLIETKIQERRYQRLLEFIGDVTKIFDNCRYYNAKESNIARCATSLEAFFMPRLKLLRSSMTN